VGAGALGLLGLFFWKVVLPVAIVGVAGQALQAVFGGPWERLPADVQRQLEARYDAAVGTRFDGLSDADAGDQVDALEQSGLARLDDASLVSRYQIGVRAFERAEPATCASAAESLFGGSDVSDDVAERLLTGLDVGDLERWFDFAVSAIEAETRGTPEQRFVTDEVMDPYFENLFGALGATDVAAMQLLSEGRDVEAAVSCHAILALEHAIAGRPASELALWARYDISP